MHRGAVEHEWLDLVADLLDTDPGGDAERRVCRQLALTFELTAAVWSVTGPDGRLTSTWHASPDLAPHRPAVEEWTAEGAHRHPVCRYYLATGDVRVVQVAELPPSVVDARCTAGWTERAASWGIPHQLALPLRSDAGGHRAFSLSRADPFTAQETQLGTALHRLLVVLDRHLTVARGIGRSSAPLTPREGVVLDLLAQGHTAAAIARRLGVAERTVRKHLQRVYGKLGARDRLDAVLRAQRIGLLPDR